MRNYVAELKTKGLTYKQLSKETGIGIKTLQGLKTGRIKMKSTQPVYEVIRNTNRRIGYRQARAAGLSPERANISRRTIFNPELETSERASIREVKHKGESTRYQTRILGEFYHAKRKENRIQEGFSHAYLELDEALQTQEAIAEAQSKLGSTGWELIRLIEHEIIEYKITSKEGTSEV